MALPYDTDDAFTGKDLEAFRAALDITQDDLADLLDVSQTTIQRWERGKKDPPAGVKDDLEHIFGDFMRDVRKTRTTGDHADAPWSRVASFWADRPELS